MAKDDAHFENKAGRSALSHAFVTRTLFVLFAVGFTIALTKLTSVLLLIAAAIIVAVLIHLISDPLREKFHVGKKIATFSAILSLIAIFGALLWLFGSQIAGQINLLADDLPEAAQSVEERVKSTDIGRSFIDSWNNDEGKAGVALGYLRDAIGGAINAGVYLVIALVAGIIFAVNPATYRDGFARFFPLQYRDRLCGAFNSCGENLKAWLVGQFISMTIIGVATSIGLMIVGLPSWLALGLLAGVAQFVPLIGPIISAIPGLVIAAAMGPTTFGWALLVYVGIQQLESNLITPYVMRQAVSLPMAITLFSIVSFTALLGPLGALFATPITVALFVLMNELYFDDDVREQPTRGALSQGEPATA